MDKIDAAVDLLRRHNLWRRGDENVEMVDVALLGTALDIACEELPRLRAELAELRAQVPELECYSKSHQGWRACGHPESCSNEKRYIYARPVPPAAVPDDVALSCDKCSAQTDNPWHGSEGDNRHVHYCDACYSAIIAANKENKT